MPICIINYGMGNVRSVAKAFEAVGAKTVLADNADSLKNVDFDSLILPGVGAFGLGVEELKKRGFFDILPDIILDKNMPFMGICLGMHLLFEASEEAKGIKGLGVLKGKIMRFVFNTGRFKVPHMGWNTVSAKPGGMFEGIGSNPFFYFCHSYYAPVDIVRGISSGVCSYGFEFCASIEMPGMWAVQFHPEKSQRLGLRVLKNFVNMAANKKGGSNEA